MIKNILITGGCGFIGSNLVNYFVKKYKNYNIINLDLLTYAADISNIKVNGCRNYFFQEGDICDSDLVSRIFKKFKISDIIHLAAESHVDNSIKNPLKFVNTNVIGTLNLLNIALKHWNNNLDNHLFYHISTDEVYGSLGNSGSFTEETKYDPHSPYSASKASSDHFVRAFNDTYGINTIISNCSNNYGPHQNEEKFIPTIINSIIKDENIPIYGEGKNIRDWLYVIDHVEAIDMIFHSKKSNETFNIGGNNELSNIDLVNKIINIIDLKRNKPPGHSKSLISYVEDRKGHDFRYSIDNSKIKNELNWKPRYTFENGIEKTIDWYMDSK